MHRYARLGFETANLHGHRLFAAICQRILGQAHRLEGDFALAGPLLHGALATVTELETPWQCGLTHFEVGELMMQQHNLDAAREHFGRAFDFFTGLKAAPAITRTRARLEAIG